MQQCVASGTSCRPLLRPLPPSAESELLRRGEQGVALSLLFPFRRIDVGRANGGLFLNNVSIGAYAVLVHHGWRRVLDAVRRRQRLTVDDETIHTRVLLVANNAYSFSGARKQLDEGRLHVYTPGGEIRVAERVDVGARTERIGVAIDGERAELATPAHFEIEPRALRLLLPSGPGA